jgi:tryptophan halogenase
MASAANSDAHMTTPDDDIRRIVIVGGGTAGWLTACLLASEFSTGEDGLQITVVESPDTPPIGVGEGTWPSMRSTLQKIGISESVFLNECNASLKQGTWFRDWQTGNGDSYYHPFTLPKAYESLNLAEYWLDELAETVPFDRAVTAQTAVCDHHGAPKQIGIPEYAFVLNYGYHLDAGRFGELLANHARQNLNVEHRLANVTAVLDHADGDIAALQTDTEGVVSGDFFVDCTGLRARLIGQHLNIPLKPIDQWLFNDRALALQVPYNRDDADVAATTWSTAQEAGWVWDIGLQHRRGIGYVFSSRHTDIDRAHQVLGQYLKSNGHPEGLGDLTPRLLEFAPGYRETLWHRNCVAVGLAAGFVEPLEASALVLVEMSARAIAEQLPRRRSALTPVAKRFNDEFGYRWRQIIDFLKLHYVLSQRTDSDYWLENRDASSIPDSLAEQLKLWESRLPWHIDEGRRDEMFPSASYLYVLMGMGFKPKHRGLRKRQHDAMQQRATQALQEVQLERDRYLRHLPSTRNLLQQLHNQPFPTR